MTDDLVKRLRERHDLAKSYGWNIEIFSEAANHIEKLETALRTINSLIPKDGAFTPAACLLAGDVAEGVLDGTWPAFGVLPRTASRENKDG